MVCTLLAGVNVVAFAADDTLSVHSFYNDATKGGDGEHLYTKDADEMSWLSSLPTWNDENEAWKAPVSSSLAVYRVYNPNSGEHHYAAADEAEWLVSQGWTQEKIAFYSDDNKGVPIYRLWNGGEGVGSHYYTTDEGEAAYLASIGWTAEGVNFYGVKEEEPGEKEMTAVQSGAAEVTVTFSEELTGLETFEVSHGLIEDSIADMEFGSDMKSVVLTLDSDIREVEYTVECSDEEYKPATFEGEEAEVALLAFKGENLIATDNTLQAAAVAFATIDQFGDYIDDDSLAQGNFTVGGGTVAQYDYEDGVGYIVVTPTTGAAFTLGSVVPVSVVYDDSTQVAQANLTVVATSVVNNMTIMDLTLNPLSDKYDDLVGKRITSNRIAISNGVNYFLPIIATDQYGNTLNADQLNDMWTNGSLYVTPEMTAGTETGVAMAVKSAMGNDVGFQDVDKDLGVVGLPIAGQVDNGKGYGTTTLNFLSTGGFSTTKSITVEQNEVVDSLELTIDSLQVGEDMPIILSAKDQYGEDLDVYDDESYAIAPAGNVLTITGTTQGDVTKITAANANSTFNYDGVFVTLEAPAALAGTTETLTVATATNKVSITKAKVNDAAKPAKVKGLADTVEATIGGITTQVDLSDSSNLVFLDDYGKVMDSADFMLEGSNAAADYTYSVTKKSGTATTGAGIITAVAPGSDVYTIKVYETGDAQKTTLASGQVTIKVSTQVFKSYEATQTSALSMSKGNLYVGDDLTDYAFVTVYGIDTLGNKVKLNPSQYTAVLRNETVAGATISCNTAAAVAAGKNDAYAVYVGNGDGSLLENASASAYVDIYACVGTATTPSKVATVELECSTVDPSALTVVGIKNVGQSNQEFMDLNKTLTLKAGATAIQGNTVTITDNTGATVEPTYTIAGLDQYGMVRVDKVTYAGGALPNTLTATDGAELVIATDNVSQIVKVVVK